MKRLYSVGVAQRTFKMPLLTYFILHLFGIIKVLYVARLHKIDGLAIWPILMGKNIVYTDALVLHERANENMNYTCFVYDSRFVFSCFKSHG